MFNYLNMSLGAAESLQRCRSRIKTHLQLRLISNPTFYTKNQMSASSNILTGETSCLLLHVYHIFVLPAAIRAAFAKFPDSMQAMSSLLSSTVFLRTKAGFPFPHFGRLRIVLEAKGDVTLT